MTLNTEVYGIYTTSQRQKQHLHVLGLYITKSFFEITDCPFNPYIIYSRVNLGRA